MLKENTKAPDFSLVGNDGKHYSLASLKDKFAILYFYPKDNTPGCTKEACDFRDNLSELANRECLVFGISRDSIAAHSKFRDKYELNFILLSDPELEMHKAYQVLEENKTVRSTFLIYKKGKIIKIWPKVKVPGHVDEILELLKSEK